MDVGMNVPGTTSSDRKITNVGMILGISVVQSGFCQSKRNGNQSWETLVS